MAIKQDVAIRLPVKYLLNDSSLEIISSSFSIAAYCPLFDFGLKKVFNEKLAFPPLYCAFYIYTYCEFHRSVNKENTIQLTPVNNMS